MKKRITIIFAVIVFNIVSLIKLFSTSDNEFEFKLIFEKEFSISVDSLFKHNFVLNSQDKKYNSNNNFFYLSLLPSPISTYGLSIPYIPEIVYVDEMENIYISDHTNGLKIYNKNGYYEMKFDYPKNFEFNKSFIDEGNNLIIDLRGNYYLNLINNKLTYKSYYINSESLNLIDYTHSEYSKIYENYFYGQKVIKNSKTVNNRISFHGIIMDISKKVNGRIVYPSHISVYRFSDNDDYLKFLDYQIPKEYIHDIKEDNILLDINVTDYSDKEIVLIRKSYLSNKGDLYLIGVQSNDTQKINEFEIKVNNPTLFLWKLEKIN